VLEANPDAGAGMLAVDRSRRVYARNAARSSAGPTSAAPCARTQGSGPRSRCCTTRSCPAGRSHRSQRTRRWRPWCPACARTAGPGQRRHAGHRRRDRHGAGRRAEGGGAGDHHRAPPARRVQNGAAIYLHSLVCQGGRSPDRADNHRASRRGRRRPDRLHERADQPPPGHPADPRLTLRCRVVMKGIHPREGVRRGPLPPSATLSRRDEERVEAPGMPIAPAAPGRIATVDGGRSNPAALWAGSAARPPLSSRPLGVAEAERGNARTQAAKLGAVGRRWKSGGAVPRPHRREHSVMGAHEGEHPA
jgi:hypothetical protein